MIPQEIIIKKRNGESLNRDELKEFIDAYVAGDVSDHQMSAFAMAVYFQGMTPEETGALVDSMMRSGDIYDLSDLDRPMVDKHSTGGVGDKISLILAPLAAACGLGVPMVSGRGLGHTGGTLDKLESIPGFDVGLDFPRFKKTVQEIGVCMIGQTDKFVPADKKLYALRDVTGTVESIPLITGSILSKKLASGARALVMDVKYGSGAFMDTREKAEQLAEAMEGVGESVGTPISCILSDMNQPLGAAVGNTVEVLEALDMLRGSGPADARDLTLTLVGEMLVLGKLAKSRDEGIEKAQEKLDDGSALRIFRQLVEMHDGDASVVDKCTLGWRGSAANCKQSLDLSKAVAGPMKLASQTHEVYAHKAGVLRSINTRGVGMAGVALGGGRKESSDDIDHGVGIIVHSDLNDTLTEGDLLYTIYSDDDAKTKDATRRLVAATEIADAE
jgi:pyrimidine-nucleoside phosphorylase